MKVNSHKKLFLLIPAVLLLLVGTAVLFINAKLNRIHYVPTDSAASAYSSLPSASSSKPGNNDGIDLPNIPYSSNNSPITVPGGTPFSKDGVFNVLFLGTDERTNGYSSFARADSIMLVSLNEKKKTIKLVSLERGVGVPIPGTGQNDWLTHTFEYGGAALTLSTVQNCFKVKVDRYIRFDFATFSKVVDAVGGVDITLSKKEADTINENMGYYAGRNSLVFPGLTHMDGKAALQYCRLREIDSDWQRIERQRTLVQAIITKTKSLNPLQMNALANELLPLLQTNLTKLEIAGLLVQSPNFAGKKAEQLTIPQKGTYWGQIGMGGRDMIAIDFAKNDAILQKFLYS